MKKEGKIKSLIAVSILIGILLITLASAGIISWIKETITGEATNVPFDLNITVGGLQIITVYNQTSAVTINEAPASSQVIINFSVYSPVGADKINTSSAQVNLSFTNEDLRENNSCKVTDYGGDYANFTCTVIMWWWDVNDTWTITASIEDNSSNRFINGSQVQAVGEQQAVQGGPAIISWGGGISPGSSNSTATNDPLLLNNSGNIPSTNITVNATHLRGEEDPTQLLWAGNFSLGWDTGATDPECGASSMQYMTYVQVDTANLTKGNFTINDGSTGQEEIYFCLVTLANNLSTQAYSSANETEGPWTADTLS